MMKVNWLIFLFAILFFHASAQNEVVTLLKNDNELIPIQGLGKRTIAVVSLGAGADNCFQSTMALYHAFDFYHAETLAALASQLKPYTTVICAIHSEKIDDYTALQSLSKQTELHLCFFLSPQQVEKYKTPILSAKSVVLAYDNTDDAQKAAAEIIMGGIAAKGKLPVSIRGLFEKGIGLSTKKVRLSYQHPQEVGMSEKILNKIAGIVQEGLDKKAFPGCQVLVAKGGVVVYNRSFGFFDYDGTHAVQPSDLYDLASVTKATATLSAVMKLYDDGKLRLQDSISRYVPLLKNTDKKGITIQNALFHESGLEPFLPLYLELIDSAGNLRIDRVSSVPKAGMSKQVADDFYLADDFDQIILQLIAGSKLKPTNRYLYSDLNF
ncbi:MAG: beta-lactamase family protein, partial [Candidatus Symbiothrix sp.]|nr:beta-lactamase family protein [Candidatus Symbiothrix sp.]